MIAGAKDDLNVTEMEEPMKQRLLAEIRSLQPHFIILDLGAGTSKYTLDFFNLANVGLVTALPEPTSIENAYRFLKAVYYSRILNQPTLQALRPLIQAAMTPNNSLCFRSILM